MEAAAEDEDEDDIDEAMQEDTFTHFMSIGNGVKTFHGVERERRAALRRRVITVILILKEEKDAPMFNAVRKTVYSSCSCGRCPCASRSRSRAGRS